jgi:hypothetical protein
MVWPWDSVSVQLNWDMCASLFEVSIGSMKLDGSISWLHTSLVLLLQYETWSAIDVILSRGLKSSFSQPLKREYLRGRVAACEASA